MQILQKISVNCNMCRSTRCRNCFEFNKSKDILLNSSNTQVSWYVLNFLADYFSVNEVTKKFLNIDLNAEVQEKNIVYVYDGSIKNYVYYKNKEADKQKYTYQINRRKRHYKYAVNK